MEETNTAENQGTTQSRQQTSSQNFEPDISANQAHALNRFPQTIYILHITTSSVKELTSVYEIQGTGEINTSQEGEIPHSDDKE